MESFEKNLIRATNKAEESNGGILVISEGVFGMRGEQGKLKEIVALKEKYNFRLLVDDAHGFGTLGKTGAGAGEEQGVQDELMYILQLLQNQWLVLVHFSLGIKMLLSTCNTICVLKCLQSLYQWQW